MPKKIETVEVAVLDRFTVKTKDGTIGFNKGADSVIAKSLYDSLPAADKAKLKTTKAE